MVAQTKMYGLILITVGLLASITGASVHVLIAGDSTVNNIAPRVGWGQRIDRQLKSGIRVINESQPGKSSKTFILEGLWDQLLTKTRSGDYIFVQFGHNDSHAPGRYESTDAETDYKDNLRKYVDDAAAAGAKVIFVTPPHRRYFNSDGTVTQELLPYANAMKAVAEEKKAPVVDLYSLSGAAMEKLGSEGTLSLYYTNDPTHFTQDGADWLAGLIADDLKRQEIPLSK
ncbi:MAG: rhamnogalacturonan acetylesterase [Kiritimatiellales bacterium]